MEKKGYQGKIDHADLINNNTDNNGVKIYNELKQELIKIDPGLKKLFDNEMTKYKELYKKNDEKRN